MQVLFRIGVNIIGMIHIWIPISMNPNEAWPHVQTGHLSVTDHACILVMVTVVWSPAIMWTVKHWSLCSSALDVIHPDSARSSAIPCLTRCRGRTRETKLTANYMSVFGIPVVITHCAPSAVVINFNSAIINTAIRQTNISRTLNTGISAVCTVIVSPSTVSAIVDMWFATWAGDVIYPYGTRALTVIGAAPSVSG